MTVYEMAQDYIRRGWSVIPIKPRDKRPMIPWKEFQTRYATPDELTEWFEETENGVGIVTGKLSNLTIVDCDSEEAIHFFEDESHRLGQNGADLTYGVKTPHGRHYYYRFVEGSSNFQAKKEWPGVDLRSEGGYVVAPPSIHPSGKPYALDIEPGFEAVLTAPPWLFEKTAPPLRLGTTAPDDLFAAAQPGQRNMALTRLAGTLLVDLPFGKALKMCQVWNRTNLEPLPEEELLRTVQSVAQKEAAKHPLPKDLMIEPVTFLEEIKALRTTGLPRGLSPGWKAIEPLYRIPPGQWTLITGIPGMGKSAFMSHLMVNLMEEEGWKFVVFSAENLPLHAFLARLLAIFLHKPFFHGMHARLTEEEVEYGVAFFQDHMRFVDVMEGTTVEDILHSAVELKEQWDFQGLTIDPWNELPHRGTGQQKETDVISDELTALRRFARLSGVHVWVVAHPAKMQKVEGVYGVPTPYDVAGSAHWRNKADFCVTVWRDMAAEDSLAQIYVQTVRFRVNGMVGEAELRFDPITGRYHDTFGV
jgi:hypothetical protein